MLDQGAISYRMTLAGVCWIASIAAALAGWAMDEGVLLAIGVGFTGIACTFMIINDNARTRRLIRLSMASQPEAPVRTLR